MPSSGKGAAGLERGDELVRFLTGFTDRRAEAVGEAAYELLRQAFRGYPLERLVPLLRSEYDPVVESGSWILSELAIQAAPLLAEVAILLEHPSRTVRWNAVDTVHSAAGTEDGPVIAKAIARVADQWGPLRTRVMDFLAWSAREQVDAAVPHLTGEVRELTGWLAAAMRGGTTAEDVVPRLDSGDPVVRSFAAAVAVVFFDDDRRPLDHAAASADEDVRRFAARELATPPGRRARRRATVWRA
ncbi:hypothetical protein [Actinophytocola gossypii]|uniref:HEAT repeat domain-containing protein n=1 Tax=Actinophytocola gossypii TaxID=2812003 RepID=A0ABT2J2X0_9PSEU|nr:hypothetical protein [Actinophytocola gossypii]MCT2582208.1 hypothetical protein [Actinophytocola gossypii]